MTRKAWGHGPQITLVCVDGWDGDVPTGRLYTPKCPQGRSFHGVTQFLREMEQVLDDMELKPTFSAVRSFAPRGAPGGHSPPESAQTGKLATFSLRVLFRQNVSWQGSVVWLEQKQTQSFRSALELILLMSDALQSQQAS